jgi:hypothetical protein
MDESRDPRRDDYLDADLERALMEEYLSGHGHTCEDLAALEDDDRQLLMLEAAAYAALRVGELAYR